LFDFATRGRLLGPIKAFKEEFSKPIEKARDKKATAWEVQKGQHMNEQLQKLLRPYFLQRLKVDYLLDQLPPKQEVVVWTDLSADQRQRYSAYIKGEYSIVRAILSGVTSALEAVTWLKKLCGHPLLVEQHLSDDTNKSNALRAALRSMDRKEVLNQSEKLKIVVELIKDFQLNGHRTLVFSQSTRMLDILEFVLTSSRRRISRIDGSTKEKDRQRLVDEFNSKRGSHDVMLLSTKAAGIGLTLTGADRVILYDPSWNPSEDGQAVDRACKFKSCGLTSMCTCFSHAPSQQFFPPVLLSDRIGQKRPVHVYRMITAGTVEEKMYEKQIHKDGIRRTVFTEDSVFERYTDSNELRKLFKLSPVGMSQVLDMIREETEHLEVDWDQYSFVSQLPSVVGLSLHDCLYSPLQRSGPEPELVQDAPTQNFGSCNEPPSFRIEAPGLVPAPSKSGRRRKKPPSAPTEPLSGPPLVRGPAQRVLVREDTGVVAVGRKMLLPPGNRSASDVTEPSFIVLGSTPIPLNAPRDPRENEIVELLDSFTELDSEYVTEGGSDVQGPKGSVALSETSIPGVTSPQEPRGIDDYVVELLDSSVEGDDEDGTEAGCGVREPARPMEFGKNSTPSVATPPELRSDNSASEFLESSTASEVDVENACQCDGEDENSECTAAVVNENGNDPPAPVSSAPVFLQRAQNLTQEGMPRRSLQALLGILSDGEGGEAYRALNPAEKIAFHRAMAAAAREAGLLHLE
jgi:hypothetical protein